LIDQIFLQLRNPPGTRVLMNRTSLIAIASICALLAGFAHAVERQRLALTNDDGWNSAGITALNTEFRARGHVTTLVGPLTQQSGSSAAFNTGKISVTRQSERVYSAAINAQEGAEPLVSGLLAINIATSLDQARPHWLVSGINQGANLGSAAQHSGTVGAAIGALSGSFGEPVSALAISTDEPKCDPACIESHYADVARFAADVLERLGRPLQSGMGLNINYPALEPDAIQGIRFTRQGRGFPIDGRPVKLVYQCLSCNSLQDGGVAEAIMQPAPDSSTLEKDSDSNAFAAGYITIVPIEGDYTAGDFRNLKRKVGGQLSTIKISRAPSPPQP
jgi:5'-nucleotidase